jgi:hypothetical protein
LSFGVRLGRKPPSWPSGTSRPVVRCDGTFRAEPGAYLPSQKRQARRLVCDLVAVVGAVVDQHAPERVSAKFGIAT